MAMVNVTINVTDVNEPGTVSFAAQPQGTLPVTRLYDVKAILQDPDIGDPNVVDDTWSWTWSWSTTRTGPFTPITDLGGTPGFGSRPRIDYYVARQEDVGRYLKCNRELHPTHSARGRAPSMCRKTRWRPTRHRWSSGAVSKWGCTQWRHCPEVGPLPGTPDHYSVGGSAWTASPETVIFNPGASVPASNNIYRIQEADFGKRLKVEWTYGCSHLANICSL